MNTNAHVFTRAADNLRAPVLFLHGFLGCGGEWAKVAEALEDDFRCLCPDLPGHGAADMKGCANMAAATAWILGFLSDAEAPRCALVGYSMGGRLALCLALNYPERFRALVLESASPGLRTHEARAQRRAADEQLAARLEAIADDTKAFRAFLEEWFAQPFFAGMARDRARLDALIARRMRHDPRRLAAALRGMGQGVQTDLWDRLSKHTIPTLAIVGEEDRKYVGIAEAMHEACPFIAVKIVPGCGHNVHFENPDGYTNALRDFLKTTP